MDKFKKLRRYIESKGREVAFQMLKVNDNLSNENVDKYTYEIDKLQVAYETLLDVANLMDDILVQEYDDDDE